MLDFLPLSQETSRSRFFQERGMSLPTFESLNQICFAYKPALSLGFARLAGLPGNRKLPRRSNLALEFTCGPFVKVLWSLAPIALLAALLMPSECVAQVAGTKTSIWFSGTQWPTGDPLFATAERAFDGRLDAEIRCTSWRGANDYRTVDLETLLTGGTENGRFVAWDYLSRSMAVYYVAKYVCCRVCPELVIQCTDNNGSGHSALQGIYGAASDPVVRAGTNGMFLLRGD